LAAAGTGRLLALSRPGRLTLIYDAAGADKCDRRHRAVVVIGFCIFGPQVLLVGTAPADLARKRDGGSRGRSWTSRLHGAAGGDVVTGYVLGHYGWQKPFYLWAAGALVAALAAGLLWIRRAAIGHEAE